MRHCRTCICDGLSFDHQQPPTKPQPSALSNANARRKAQRERNDEIYGDRVLRMLDAAVNRTLPERVLIRDACEGNGRAWKRIARDLLEAEAAKCTETSFSTLWTLLLTQLPPPPEFPASDDTVSAQAKLSSSGGVAMVA